jgi:hypothetical protein
MVEGIVLCGAPLVSDARSITSTSEVQIISIKTGLSATTTVISESTILFRSRVSSNTYNPIISVTSYAPATDSTSTGTATRLSRRDPTHLIASPNDSPAPTTISMSTASLPLDSTDRKLRYPIPHKVNVVAVSTTFIRRSYDFNNCLDQLPSHDFVTNSLPEVCHFVANVQDLFVSLAPTSAAYTPSWASYFISTVILVIQVIIASRPPAPRRTLADIVARRGTCTTISSSLFGPSQNKSKYAIQSSQSNGVRNGSVSYEPLCVDIE